jgi:hypothetical protein
MVHSMSLYIVHQKGELNVRLHGCQSRIWISCKMYLRNACLLAFSYSKRLKEDDGPESSSDASTAAVAVTCSMFCGKVEISLKD